MTKTKDVLQNSFPVGEMVCVTLISGRELHGAVEQFLDRSLVLRHADGAFQHIDYGIIGTLEKSGDRRLKARLAVCVERQQQVSVATKHGMQFSGAAVELDDDVICIRAENGTETLIALDYIGTFTTAVNGVSQSVQQTAAPSVFAAPTPSQMTAAQRLKELAAPLEQKKLSLSALQAKLREDSTLATECTAKLNSLQHAVKINEYEAKYQRTPRILAELIQVARTYYANPALLAIIGEVALMAGETAEIDNALECYQTYWDPFCARDENLMRLLAVLCEQTHSAAPLTALVQKWCQGAETAFARAMAHYADAVGAMVPDSVFSDGDIVLCCQKLWELLTSESFSVRPLQASSASVATEVSVSEGSAAEESSESVLPPLEPGQRCGRITLFIPANGFGVITDTEGHTYSFVTHNMTAEEAEQIHYGAVVYFYKGLEPRYNKKKQQYVDIAEMIRVMADADDADMPLPSKEPEFPIKRCNAENMADKEIGYVMLYRPAHRSGYISHEMNYGTAERGDIFFEAVDMQEPMPLDTYHYHYKVAFNYVNGLQRRATNVIVLERLPKPEAGKKAPAVLPLAHEDYDKLQFCQGETLLAECTDGEAVLGRFVSYEDHVLMLDVNGTNRGIPVDSMKELFFAGVVTHYQVQALSGKVNGQYSFRIHNVVGQEPDSILKQGLAQSMPCLYSLRVQNNELRVRTLRAFDEGLLSKLPWRTGKVAGAFRNDLYFTADDTVRCHISSLKDQVTRRWMQQQDFLRQEICYRYVYHKSAEKGTLSLSAVQVMAKHQLAEVVSPLGIDGLRLQCGTQYFETTTDLSVYPLGKQLRAVLAVDASGGLTVAELDAEQLTLPTYAAAIAEEKQTLEEELAKAEAQSDWVKIAELNHVMLQQAMLPPEKAIGAIYQAALRSQDYSLVQRSMESHGYLLPQVLRLGYLMQLQCLMSDISAAQRTALHYLAMNSTDASTTAIARELAKGELDAEALRTHILEDKTFADTRCAGKIWMFNPVTRQGNIVWAKGKLNFSYKDFVDISTDTLDLQKYEYYVAFRVDESHHVPKAAEVELLCQVAQKQ